MSTRLSLTVMCFWFSRHDFTSAPACSFSLSFYHLFDYDLPVCSASVDAKPCEARTGKLHRKCWEPEDPDPENELDPGDQCCNCGGCVCTATGTIYMSSAFQTPASPHLLPIAHTHLRPPLASFVVICA